MQHGLRIIDIDFRDFPWKNLGNPTMFWTESRPGPLEECEEWMSGLAPLALKFRWSNRFMFFNAQLSLSSVSLKKCGADSLLGRILMRVRFQQYPHEPCDLTPCWLMIGSRIIAPFISWPLFHNPIVKSRSQPTRQWNDRGIS